MKPEKRHHQLKCAKQHKISMSTDKTNEIRSKIALNANVSRAIRTCCVHCTSCSYSHSYVLYIDFNFFFVFRHCTFVVCHCVQCCGMKILFNTVQRAINYNQVNFRVIWRYIFFVWQQLKQLWSIWVACI